MTRSPADMQTLTLAIFKLVNLWNARTNKLEHWLLATNSKLFTTDMCGYFENT